MDYSYKQLTGADAALLKELLGVFGEAFGDVRTYQDAVPDDAYLTSLLGKDNFRARISYLSRRTREMLRRLSCMHLSA